MPFSTVLVFCILYIISVNCLQCTDENNKNVDWFVVYKIPKQKHDNDLIKNGVGYVYLTSKNYSDWILSPNAINETESIIGNTLKPLYTREKIASYVLYNDQPPDAPSKESKGHTKGVILSDLNSGLWLIHSVPHFPTLANYNLNKSETLKGQSFLCVSLDLKNLNKVGLQLMYNEPQIYESYISEPLKTKLANLVKATSGVVIEKAPWYNALPIFSLDEVQFISFAKSHKFGKDLYHDWVGPALASDLLVETWLNGPGRLPSNCTNNIKVYNIENIGIKEASVKFSSSIDHSKWAVSVQDSWICIGDINRMERQEQRGGGTVCLNNLQLTENYLSLVVSKENCPSNIP